ncbi:unnamed protein product [Amoebophrya sp. A120]|nr:unnamed protein product [Amoebophrya sp. A120]|eukprot:GSA120T00018651001.1
MPSSPGAAGAAASPGADPGFPEVGSLPAMSSTAPFITKPKTYKDWLQDYAEQVPALSKGARARFQDASSLFLEEGDWKAAKRLFDQVTLESRLGMGSEQDGGGPGGQNSLNTAEDLSNDIVDSVRALSVSGAEMRRPELVKQQFFFTLFWTEALESALTRESSASAQLLLEYGCGNFVSVEDALQCLQQVSDSDLYAVDLVLPLLALHETVASEAADAMSRLCLVEENQETILKKPSVDLLLRASKYHFVSAPLQTGCWRAIRALCTCMPEMAIPQIMLPRRIKQDTHVAGDSGEVVPKEDHALHLLFHLVSHHSDETAFLKEGFQTLTAIFKSNYFLANMEQLNLRPLMKDVLDFSFLFLSDLKEDFADGMLLRSATAVLRVALKKLAATEGMLDDEEDMYTHVLRRLTYVIATYSKRQEGAVPKPEDGTTPGAAKLPKASPSKQAAAKIVTSMAGSHSQFEVEGLEDLVVAVSPVKELDTRVSEMFDDPDALSATLFMNNTKKIGSLPNNMLASLFDSWDRVCSSSAAFNSPGKAGGDQESLSSPSGKRTQHSSTQGTMLTSKSSAGAQQGSASKKKGHHQRSTKVPKVTYESWEMAMKVELSLSLLDTTQAICRDKSCWQACTEQIMRVSVAALRTFGSKRERITLEALKNLSGLPPEMVIEFEPEMDLIKTICGKILVQYERSVDVVIYACRLLQGIQTDDVISGKMMKYLMIQRCLRLIRAHPMHADCSVDILKVLRLLLAKGDNRGLVFLKYGGCEELSFCLRRFDQDWKDAPARRLLIFTFSFLAELTEADAATKRRISLGTGRDTGTCLLRVPIEQQDPELREQVGDFMRRFEGESDNVRPLVV